LPKYGNSKKELEKALSLAQKAQRLRPEDPGEDSPMATLHVISYGSFCRI